MWIIDVFLALLMLFLIPAAGACFLKWVTWLWRWLNS